MPQGSSPMRITASVFGLVMLIMVGYSIVLRDAMFVILGVIVTSAALVMQSLADRIGEYDDAG